MRVMIITVTLSNYISQQLLVADYLVWYICSSIHYCSYHNKWL